MTFEHLSTLLNHRLPDTYKWHYGHALLVAGSYGRMGCAVLAARASLRSGVGLVTVHMPSCGVDIMQTTLPEAMVSPDPSPTIISAPPSKLEHYRAIAVGPGIGTTNAVADALCRLLKAIDHEHQTLILDADALNIIALRPRILPLLPHGTIITPHQGEYQRLFANADPAQMATQHHLTIVQKGHRTRVVSPSGDTYTNTTGNSGMATAGSGDVLTGIILGLAAQGLAPFDAACAGVMLHGKSADIAVQKQSQASLIASDIVENLKLATLDTTTT